MQRPYRFYNGGMNTTHPNNTNSELGTISRFIRKEMKRLQVPGVSIGIYHKGKSPLAALLVIVRSPRNVMLRGALFSRTSFASDVRPHLPDTYNKRPIVLRGAKSRCRSGH